MASQRFPVPDPTESFWLSQPSKLAHFKSHPAPPEHVDIAIIGSGLTGVSTAYHLLKSQDTGPKARIAIFEARTACSGATGRNGGHTKVSLNSLMGLCARWGSELTSKFARLANAQRSAIQKIVEEEHIDCDFFLTRSFDVFFDVEHAAKMKKWLKTHKVAGDPLCDVLSDVQFLAGENVERITGARGAKAAVSSPAASLWPYKFVMGLLARFLDLGGEFYADSPVREVSYLENNGEDAVTLLHFDSSLAGAISTTRARQVVFATNGYSSALLHEFHDAITPVRGTASHLSVDASHRDPSVSPPYLTHTYNLHYDSGNVDYLVPRPDGTIIVGGAQYTYRADRQAWWDNVDDANLLEMARPHFDSRMQKVYLGWQDSGAHIDKLWTGVMGYTADSMPHVGAVPGKYGQWIAAGFNGGGMAMIVTSTEALVKLVRGEATDWKQLGLPSTFEPTLDRLAPKSRDRT